MEITTLKLYRTRAGYKARIYATDGTPAYPIHGAIRFGTGWVSAFWRKNGSQYARIESAIDLVSEWVEHPIVHWPSMPAWAYCVAMDSSGTWWWYDEKPYATSTEWQIGDRRYCGEIPEEYKPEYNGDWKDSLVMRT